MKTTDRWAQLACGATYPPLPLYTFSSSSAATPHSQLKDGYVSFTFPPQSIISDMERWIYQNALLPRLIEGGHRVQKTPVESGLSGAMALFQCFRNLAHDLNPVNPVYPSFAQILGKLQTTEYSATSWLNFAAEESLRSQLLTPCVEDFETLEFFTQNQLMLLTQWFAATYLRNLNTRVVFVVQDPVYPEYHRLTLARPQLCVMPSDQLIFIHFSTRKVSAHDQPMCHYSAIVPGQFDLGVALPELHAIFDQWSKYCHAIRMRRRKFQNLKSQAKQTAEQVRSRRKLHSDTHNHPCTGPGTGRKGNHAKDHLALPSSEALLWLTGILTIDPRTMQRIRVATPLRLIDISNLFFIKEPSLVRHRVAKARKDAAERNDLSAGWSQYLLQGSMQRESKPIARVTLQHITDTLFNGVFPFDLWSPEPGARGSAKSDDLDGCETQRWNLEKQTSHAKRKMTINSKNKTSARRQIRHSFESNARDEVYNGDAIPTSDRVLRSKPRTSLFDRSIHVEYLNIKSEVQNSSPDDSSSTTITDDDDVSEYNPSADIS